MFSLPLLALRVTRASCVCVRVRARVFFRLFRDFILFFFGTNNDYAFRTPLREREKFFNLADPVGARAARKLKYVHFVR